MRNGPAQAKRRLERATRLMSDAPKVSAELLANIDCHASSIGDSLFSTIGC